MTLRRRLALRYAVIVGACTLLLAGLAYHEFVVEPHVRRLLGQAKPSGSSWGEIAEIVFHALIPVVLVGGWWFMKRILAPLDALARAVERIHAGNLDEPLPRPGTGDEVDRLTDVFNRTTARLHKSFQQVREFTLHASHELKTPLTVMRVQIESVLHEGGPIPAAQREALLAQLDEIQRLAHLVDSLTLLAKAESGSFQLQRQPVPLDELVRELVDDLLILSEPARLEVRLIACHPAVVLGDRHRLRQLLLNLADNAVKYNRPGGSVIVSLAADATHADLRISNSGKGIPADVQDRVFDRFFRTQDARERGIEGSGLGLSVCRWIVEAHAGTIHLATRPDGLTTAEVTLPLAAVPPPRSA